jgi:hypothetical protein
MELRDAIALGAGLISAVSAGCALLSWRSARAAANRAALSERVKVFVDLRQRWYEIRKDLRRMKLDRNDLPQPKHENWDTHELYWQHAFTEWYVTTKLHPELAELWNGFFSLAIQNTLKTHPPLRYVAWVLVEQHWTVFSGQHDAFRAELERLNGDPLNDGTFTLPKDAAERDAAPGRGGR